MKPQTDLTFSRRSRILSVFIVILLWLGSPHAQTYNTTDGTTPAGIAPGSPSGSFTLSGFETINPYAGKLNMRFPLVQISGRGGAVYSLTLPIQQNWTVDKWYDYVTGQPHYFPTDAHWSAVPDLYGNARVLMRRVSDPDIPCQVSGGSSWTYTLTRITFTSPDGTEYELRDATTGGQKQTSSCVNGGAKFNRGTVFKTADGSAATFIASANVYDATNLWDNQVGMTGTSPVSGDLYLRDGTRYHFNSDGYVDWMRDRNGNKLTFSYNGLTSKTVTDSLNRQILTEYNVTESAPYGVCTRITLKGFGGADRIIRVSSKSLSQVLRTTQVGDSATVKTYVWLFPELDGSYSNDYNPAGKMSDIWLPDGRRYQLFYNVYGEVARVVLPTGGAIEYDWDGGVSGGASSGVFNTESIYRRVVATRVYADATNLSSLTHKTSYSKIVFSGWNTAVDVTVEQRDINNALLARSRHYYDLEPLSSIVNEDPFKYSAWKEAKEVKTESFDSGGTTIKTRIENLWQQPINGNDWPLTTAETSSLVRDNHPQITQVVSSLMEANLVSKQTYAYDQYLNKTDTYEYDYGTGTAGTLVRRSHTDFVTTNPVNSVNYATTASIHIRNLPSQTQVFDASNNKKAETKFEYDDYSATTNHAALVNRSNISGFDTSFTTSYTTRGNVTKVSQWRNTDNAYLSAYSQYDIAGNVVKTIDANDNATNLEFNDRFGSPDGEAQSNNTPPSPGSTWLNGQSTFAFPTKVTNALGHIAYTQMDYFLGKPVDTEDPNNIKGSLYYNDSLDRLTKGIRAVGTSLQNQTLITYDDTNRTITTATDRDTNTDGILQRKSLYDGLGRTWRTAAYEGSSSWAIVETQFDALGRAYRSTNPFRGATPTAALPGNPEWTTTTFDALSRITQVTTPDGAHVDTFYNGNQVLVSDQATKKRMSETDALGRLKKVWEIRTPDASTVSVSFAGQSYAGYLTNYTYDTLDSLTTVTQQIGTSGTTQTRTFAYDSLKRLTQATNPESGTTTYNYDNNGNLIYKIDALSRETWYGYDALNRSTGYYTDDANTPQVVHIYDTATLGKGRLGYSFTTSYWVGCISWKYLTYNPITAYDALGRPAGVQQYYRDGADTTWGTAYATSRTYDLASNVKSQTYPSGRVVNYSYNTANQLTTFSGNLGDGVSRNYATEISYTAAGQLTHERFGQGVSGMTLLYHNLHYNNRQQLYDIRLGSNADGMGTEWTWNRGAIRLFYDSNFAYGNGGTNNNGNVYRMDHFVPENDSATTWSMSLDYYGYDDLNRITGVWENKAAHNQGETSTGLTQQYVYDRFGNRTVNNAVSNFPGVFNLPFTVDQTNNRLLAPNSTISYNAVGNQINDGYSGAGARTYDANNKLVSAAGSSGTVSYSYNANGSRVTKTVGSTTTWYIYGLGGELVAEYPANGAVGTPQKEYGYRSGQMLVVYDSTETGNKQVQWLVQDHLGSTRMVVDLSGSLTTMKRHDYLPFGEEILANSGGRTAAQGYPPPDDKIRQKFTGYERDAETGLDYAQARMYANGQGRFTSPDDFLNDTITSDPMSWNLYVYVRNNPLRFLDPRGSEIVSGNLSDEERSKIIAHLRKTTGYNVIGFGRDNKLYIDVTKGYSEGSATARKMLLDAAKSTSQIFTIQAHNDSKEVAFAAISPGTNVTDGSSGKLLRTDYEIKIDFNDFDKIGGDNDAKSSFSLGLTLFHEFGHRLYGDLSDDPNGLDNPGPVENKYVNPIRQELNEGSAARLPFRAAYGGMIDRGSGFVNLKFKNKEGKDRVIYWRDSQVGGTK